MQNILYILAHPEHVESIASLLLYKTFTKQFVDNQSTESHLLVYHKDSLLQQQQPLKSRKVNSSKGRKDSILQVQQLGKDEELVVAFINIFFVYIHNNLLYKKKLSR